MVSNLVKFSLKGGRYTDYKPVRTNVRLHEDFDIALGILQFSKSIEKPATL